MSIHTVRRFEDQSNKGYLQLSRQNNGDIVVMVTCDPDQGLGFSCSAVGFNVPFAHGGQSKHTHKALGKLLDAMEKDNAERKQVRKGVA